MATESVVEPSTTQAAPAQCGKFQAKTTLYSDNEWDNLCGRLSGGVTNRLKRADRAVYALTRLSEMLFADSIGKSDAGADNEVTFPGLPLVDIEALHIAVIALAGIAGEALEEIREDKFGCIGGSKEKRA